ncbi:hypothetical protein NCPPB3923_01830 [Burkholderia glumae]|nr:hypothetical protein NCPPB3923_01830 [Burkholderia glumae]
MPSRSPRTGRFGSATNSAGAGSIWLRHALSSFKPRLVALEKQAAAKGIVLSGDEVAALERSTIISGT